jgi:hypothetical protein
MTLRIVEEPAHKPAQDTQDNTNAGREKEDSLFSMRDGERQRS